MVTGGNRGIGLGMAEALAQAGPDVAIWGRNTDANAAAVTKLQTYGTRIHSTALDLADERAVDEAMAQVIANFGRLDCFVATPGSGCGEPGSSISTRAICVR